MLHVAIQLKLAQKLVLRGLSSAQGVIAFNCNASWGSSWGAWQLSVSPGLCNTTRVVNSLPLSILNKINTFQTRATLQHRIKRSVAIERNFDSVQFLMRIRHLRKHVITYTGVLASNYDIYSLNLSVRKMKSGPYVTVRSVSVIIYALHHI